MGPQRRFLTACAGLAGVALATSTLAAPPTAHATCASFFGIGNSASCFSNPTSIAIAIGSIATARAQGWFGLAISLGDSSDSLTYTGSVLNLAIAAGDNATAGADGYLSVAAAIGNEDGYALAGDTGTFANLALTLGPGDTPFSRADNGNFNTAISLFADGEVSSIGNFNAAYGVGTRGNAGSVSATGTASQAFDLFGTNNTVTAGPGPLAIAGSVLQTGASITKSGPGFNINGIVVGGAAATSGKKKPAASPTARSNAKEAAKSTGRSNRKN